MTPAEILAALPGLSALVVGDICLDRWCTYDPELCEASRETQIPRVAVVRTEVTAGAGGTVANNLVALGLRHVAVLGAVGEDGHGYELARALEKRQISSEMLVHVPEIQTFTYTKLINVSTGIEDQPRVDFISRPHNVDEKLIDRLHQDVEKFDVIFIADQAETSFGGVITAALRNRLGELAQKHPDKVFWADSRARMELFRHVVIKGNRDEAEAASYRALGCCDMSGLREYCETGLLVVTEGPEGARIVDSAGEHFCKTKPIPNPVDICGAGDAFSAGAAPALALTRSPIEAVQFGNLVASITIMKPGTGTASPEEVLEAVGA